MALTDCDIRYDSALCLAEGSHNLSGFEATKADVPSKFQVRLCNWQTAEFNAGDMVIFNIKTVHAASKQLRDKCRIRYMHVYCVRG